HAAPARIAGSGRAADRAAAYRLGAGTGADGNGQEGASRFDSPGVARAARQGRNRRPLSAGSARASAQRVLRMSELAPYAAHEAQSRGRRYSEAPPAHRTEYQRDRDRI